MRPPKIVVVATAAAVLLCGLGGAGGAVAQVGQRSLDKSVVMVRSVQQEFDYITPWKQTEVVHGIGSGFVIGGRKILTNAHNASNYKYVEVRKEYEARRYPAEVAFIGHDCDLAILTVDDDSFFNDMVPLELGPLPKVNSL